MIGVKVALDVSSEKTDDLPRYKCGPHALVLPRVAIGEVPIEKKSYRSA